MGNHEWMNDWFVILWMNNQTESFMWCNLYKIPTQHKLHIHNYIYVYRYHCAFSWVRLCGINDVLCLQFIVIELCSCNLCNFSVNKIDKIVFPCDSWAKRRDGLDFLTTLYESRCTYYYYRTYIGSYMYLGSPTWNVWNWSVRQ